MTLLAHLLSIAMCLAGIVAVLCYPSYDKRGIILDLIIILGLTVIIAVNILFLIN